MALKAKFCLSFCIFDANYIAVCVPYLLSTTHSVIFHLCPLFDSLKYFFSLFSTLLRSVQTPPRSFTRFPLFHQELHQGSALPLGSPTEFHSPPGSSTRSSYRAPLSHQDLLQRSFTGFLFSFLSFSICFLHSLALLLSMWSNMSYPHVLPLS